jgi:predicted enzyme related to lactoylglutathione lyase
MLKKVVYVSVLVSDQDKALDFYTNVIGFEKRGDYPTPDGPRFLTVGVKGQDFELVLWPGTPARGDLGSAVYTIEVEDIQTAFETLKSRGVKFEPPEVLEFPWGYAARFQDPDGNLLQVREGKGEFRLWGSADRHSLPAGVSAGAPHALGNTGRETAHLLVEADLALGASLTMTDRHYGHLARDGGELAIRLLDELNAPAVNVRGRPMDALKRAYRRIRQRNAPLSRQ